MLVFNHPFKFFVILSLSSRQEYAKDVLSYTENMRKETNPHGRVCILGFFLIRQLTRISATIRPKLEQHLHLNNVDHLSTKGQEEEKKMRSCDSPLFAIAIAIADFLHMCTRRGVAESLNKLQAEPPSLRLTDRWSRLSDKNIFANN